MTNYDPYNDIQRYQSEIQTSTVAQQVLDQYEPELKNLSLKLETLTFLQRNLQDKSVVLNTQLQLAESQRLQIFTLFQDYASQLEHLDQELKQQYQDLVSLKSNLESYGSMAVGDVNSLRLIRDKLTQEQSYQATQSDMIREEKNRVLAEIELNRKETDRINEEISQFDTNSVSRSMAAISLVGQQQMDSLIGQPINFPVQSGAMQLPTFTPALMQGYEQQQNNAPEIKGRERRKSRNVDSSLKDKAGKDKDKKGKKKK